ncbi:hypothetical protein AM4_053 [Lactococcus phage AM4]|uniref:Uncharacterized protein n=2 Tax=Audreyjarvisvirus AM4 TaxID=2845189 RepID=A0A1W6JKG1_9CAUD|nr:hypothetical protein H1Z35_gp053 [Lactococcus phage AM4]ARM66712.1 hypothetical protein AM4_053 [Lactococcus phage AM4]ARM66945.1 hypothetical protein AM5_092 [Lactococcus phage AM5]
MKPDSTEEITFARELLVNLWQFRGIQASESGRSKMIPIIGDFIFRDEKDLKEPIDFLIKELQTAKEQLENIN